jgi:hypothetical protein
MPQEFDPYYKWLGIPPHEQPPDHYRLLGIPSFTSDPEVIENAADQRMVHLRAASAGKRAAQAQKILNELSEAKVCLLNSEQRTAYDVRLKAKTAASLPKALPAGREVNSGTRQSPKTAADFTLSSHSAKPRRSALPASFYVVGMLVAVLVLGGVGIAVMWNWWGVESQPKFAQNESASHPALSPPEPSRQTPENKATSAVSKAIPPVPKQEGKNKAPSVVGSEVNTSSPPVTAAQPEVAPDAELPAKSAPDASVNKAERIAKLETEWKTAVAGGDLRAAFPAVEELARLTSGDALKMKIEGVIERSAKTQMPADIQELVRQMLDLLKAAIKDGRLELASQHVDRLLAMARKSTDRELEREATLLVLQLK